MSKLLMISSGRNYKIVKSNNLKTLLT